MRRTICMPWWKSSKLSSIKDLGAQVWPTTTSMSDGWLYYFVSIICLAVAILLFSLDAACSRSSETDRPRKRVPSLIPLRRWVLILGCVLSTTGLAMFVAGISVNKDAELVNRDTYFAIGGILLGVSLILFFLAVSLTTYREVTVADKEEEEPTTTLDPLDAEESSGIALDPLDAEPMSQELNLDPLDAEKGSELDLLG